jgi:outer membrane protein assembly factor BamB
VNSPEAKSTRPIRWWPGLLLLVALSIAIAWVRGQDDWPFQKRNLAIAQIVIIGGILLLVWWTFLSRAPNRLRLGITFSMVGLALVGAALFRITGMSGDLRPIVEFRWAKAPELQTASAGGTNLITAETELHAHFPQFLGPNRDGVLAGPKLETNWLTHPPEVVWRQPVGAGWSGFAIVGELCLTQEQIGAEESVAAYELRTGKLVWRYTYAGRYHTTIAGEGPRATPTVVSNRVFACGSTGILNCLDLATGKLIWSRDLIAESASKVPTWGYAISPLVVDDLVIVHGGEGANRSLFAFRCEDGEPAWSAGTQDVSYASPRLATLAETQQILAFNNGSVSGHDPLTGRTLWERNWGNGNVVCASPVVVSSNQVLFSSGYGVGAELLEISQTGSNRFGAALIWKSIRMKSKFAHLYARDGSLFGLDDGIFAAVNLTDGALHWKEGRYGHGQGLVVDDLYVLMAESGELILLRPTAESPNELARFRVFNSKTWNPPALARNLLLVRNDREAVCLQLKTVE